MDTVIPSEKENLLPYLESLLIDAGVPEEPRQYLIDISRPQLMNVQKKDMPTKKELLRKNLSILLIKLAPEKSMVFKENNVDSLSSNYELVTSHEFLESLRSHKVFNEVTIKDIEVNFKSLCPIWPWC